MYYSLHLEQYPSQFISTKGQNRGNIGRVSTKEIRETQLVRQEFIKLY